MGLPRSIALLRCDALCFRLQLHVWEHVLANVSEGSTVLLGSQQIITMAQIDRKPGWVTTCRANEVIPNKVRMNYGTGKRVKEDPFGRGRRK
jgi:hypothetical protein